MLNALEHRRGCPILCIDDKLKQHVNLKVEEVQHPFLIFGSVYRVSSIKNKMILTRTEDGLYIPQQKIMVRLMWVKGCWFLAERFAPADDYKNVIRFYRDLILHPPENKAC